MVLKILWIFYLLIYSLTVICNLKKGLSCFIKPIWVHAVNYYNMNVILNSESNKITVIPTQNTRIMSNSNIVDYKFEFNLTKERIQEINEILGIEITNNVLTGSNSDYVINIYIILIILENNIDPLIYELLTNFIS